MGNYLNTITTYDAYLKEYHSPYFIDKSLMLEELTARVDMGTNYICITRPRRFGKTVMANMIASFFSRECNTDPLFGRLKIAGSEGCREHMGKHDVIFISLNELPRKCKSYAQYINRIEDRLMFRWHT